MFYGSEIRLFNSLSDYCQAGMSPGRALGKFAERRGKKHLAEMAREVESGVSFAEAMRRRPERFALWQTELVAAGEALGRLDHSFVEIAASLSRVRKFWLDIIPKLAYPVFLLHFGAFCLNFGSPQGMISFLLPFYLAGAALYLFLNNIHSLLRWIRILPFVSPFVRANLAQYLSLFIRSGMNFPSALMLAGRASHIPGEDAKLQAAVSAAQQGASVLNSLKLLELFDAEELDCVDVGEEAGDLDRILERLAQETRARNEANVATICQILSTLIVVAIMLKMASAIVGFYRGYLTVPTIQ